jgi:hypothetical protein
VLCAHGHAHISGTLGLDHSRFRAQAQNRVAIGERVAWDAVFYL